MGKNSTSNSAVRESRLLQFLSEQELGAESADANLQFIPKAHAATADDVATSWHFRQKCMHLVHGSN